MQEKPGDNGGSDHPPSGGGGGDDGYGEDHEHQDNWWKKEANNSIGEPVNATPPIDPKRANIEAATRINEGMRADLKAHPEWNPHVKMMLSRLRWAEELSGDSHTETQKIAVEEIAQKYPERFAHIDLENITESQIKEAREFIHKEIDISTEELNKIRNGTNAPKIVKASSQAAEKELEAEGAKGLNFITNFIDGHAKWLDGKSDATRLTIANAEILVGSIVGMYGLGWVLRSIKGEQTAASVKVQDNGEVSETFAVQPMSRTDRLLKATLGLGTIAAGIGTTYLGFSSFSRRH